MTPDDVLKRVGEIIEGRGADYGDAADMFEEVSRRWSAPVFEDVAITQKGVALMMADLKMARLRYKWSDDSAIDAIAYLVFAVMFASKS